MTEPWFCEVVPDLEMVGLLLLGLKVLRAENTRILAGLEHGRAFAWCM